MNPLIIQSEPGKPVLHLSGRIDAVNGSQLENYLKTLPTSDLYLVLDLSACSYVSSAGIRILLITHKQKLAMGGRLYLSGLLPEFYQILEMAGLQRIFHIVETIAKALECIDQLSATVEQHQVIERRGKRYEYKLLDRDPSVLLQWTDPGIVSYAELGFSVGIGAPADNDINGEDSKGIFVTTGHCAGFIEEGSPAEGDFRIASDPSRSGIKVEQAYSFKSLPTGLLTSLDGANTNLAEIIDLSRSLNDKTVVAPTTLMVVMQTLEPTPSLWVLLLSPNDSTPLPTGSGICFRLAEGSSIAQGNGCIDWLNSHLTYENIVEVKPVSLHEELRSPLCWLFVADAPVDASQRRLRIETAADLQLSDVQKFLVRRLYTDSSRVVISPLHGGYSAETFQVDSYDADGRKMRPTVLKVANRAMITRESERCQLYSQPYIFNNSAAVLGTEFHGNTGALRYNFVGIDGYDTRLRWLTHDFHQLPVDELLPLFDKIFLQILRPWYGQPVHKIIFPFKDHDPTLTFFPHIYNVVSELFGISADHEYIYAEELGREVLNPYWYLKHKFPKQRDEGLLYWEGICHGDLNMQNILLDEHQNVYLIDFSETKPRAVVSDFARLEAIFMIDNAQIDKSGELADYLSLILPFYQVERLDEQPAMDVQGLADEKLRKILTLTQRMRSYALGCVAGDSNIVPYYLALLEWVMPIVCYNSVTIAQKRLSMLVSALLCEKIRRAGNV